MKRGKKRPNCNSCFVPRNAQGVSTQNRKKTLLETADLKAIIILSELSNRSSAKGLFHFRMEWNEAMIGVDWVRV